MGFWDTAFTVGSTILVIAMFVSIAYASATAPPGVMEAAAWWWVA